MRTLVKNLDLFNNIFSVQHLHFIAMECFSSILHFFVCYKARHCAQCVGAGFGFYFSFPVVVFSHASHRRHKMSQHTRKTNSILRGSCEGLPFLPLQNQYELKLSTFTELINNLQQNFTVVSVAKRKNLLNFFCLLSTVFTSNILHCFHANCTAFKCLIDEN